MVSVHCLTYDAGPTRDLAGEAFALCVVSGPASRVKCIACRIELNDVLLISDDGLENFQFHCTGTVGWQKIRPRERVYPYDIIVHNGGLEQY